MPRPADVLTYAEAVERTDMLVLPLVDPSDPGAIGYTVDAEDPNVFYLWFTHLDQHGNRIKVLATS